MKACDITLDTHIQKMCLIADVTTEIFKFKNGSVGNFVKCIRHEDVLENLFNLIYLFTCLFVCLLSRPKAHRWAYSIARHLSSIHQYFQKTSLLKPWCRFLPNFTYSIYRSGKGIMAFFFVSIGQEVWLLWQLTVAYGN